MKLNLDPDILKMPLENILKEALQNTKDIKEKAYLSLAYFQYLNKLSTNKAITLFKEYILSDGQKSKYSLSIYILRNRKPTIKNIEVPLKIDDLLAQNISELRNYKDLISRINKSKYIKFVKNYLKINASDITAYAIYKMINDIGIHELLALNKHWALFTRNLLPHLIKKV